jgi:hypothetical protein
VNIKALAATAKIRPPVRIEPHQIHDGEKAASVSGGADRANGNFNCREKRL